MRIPVKNILTDLDLKIAKVGRETKPVPCSQVFGNYLEYARKGNKIVPRSVMKALYNCGEEWDRVS